MNILKKYKIINIRNNTHSNINILKRKINKLGIQLLDYNLSKFNITIFKNRVELRITIDYKSNHNMSEVWEFDKQIKKTNLLSNCSITGPCYSGDQLRDNKYTLLCAAKLKYIEY